MELKKNKEAWLSISKKLWEVRESQIQRSIYRVHNRYLHGTNDKAYVPEVVAIGPYHRGCEGLQMMEEHKVRYLNSLHMRNNQTVERCISAVGEIEVEARGCYSEDINLSPAEFIEMLVLDGCFILQLLKMKTQQDSTTDVVVDSIFKMEWVWKCLKRDLILFENQIPFLVLCKLFDLIEAPNQHRNLVEMFCFFSGMNYSRWNDRSPHEVKHLIHLMHIFMRSCSPASDQLISCPAERQLRLIPTATELKDANVKFCASEGDDSFFIHFDKGQLTMSPLTIVDGIEILYRNLIVYEQYFPDNKSAVMTDYAVVLDCLVNTRRDVKILSECGIIHSRMGNNQVTADIINRLTHSVPPLSEFFLHGNTFGSINAHYNSRWNRARATLSRDYFYSPWAYVSFVATVLLLLLTLAQTIFSALQL